jgi:hypothetical protein
MPGDNWIGKRGDRMIKLSDRQLQMLLILMVILAVKH